MATLDRRNFMTLEDISHYWRNVHDSNERPLIHNVCNAMRTLDLAFGGSLELLSRHLSQAAWSDIRNDLFNVLVSNFPGHFIVYSSDTATPVEPGMPWPAAGYVEFYPEQARRKSDVYAAQINKLHPDVVLGIRWAHADKRASVSPDDFDKYHQQARFVKGQEQPEAADMLDRLYEICQCEAKKSKKIAHRRWLHLQSQFNSCPDRKARAELRRELSELQVIWGTPSI